MSFKEVLAKAMKGRGKDLPKPAARPQAGGKRPPMPMRGSGGKMPPMPPRGKEDKKPPR